MRNTRRHYTRMSDVSATAPSGIIVTQNLNIYNALVRQLQFSSNGGLLATTGYVKSLLQFYASHALNLIHTQVG
jgi:hypothetical protein